MPSSWGRPPRNDIWQDLQALALWILIIGVAGFLFFPTFFKDVYSRLTDTTATVSTDSGTLNNYGVNLDSSNLTQGTSSLLNPQGYSSSVINGLYGNNNEISTGYWVIFVADGSFKQLPVTSESYTFLTNLIERDKNADPKNTLILAANGQIRKYTVSNEIYAIITNMALIDTRTRTTG